MFSVSGFAAAGFEEVEKEFRRNFEERRELGAALAVYFCGEKVVDLWGGQRDRTTGAPWLEDTLVPVFSTSKGLAALTLLLAHARGWLDFDERVAAYWPEFAQNGKASITVRQLLAHEAGLPAIDEPLDPARLADRGALARTLARQKPAWRPGSRHGYHGLSLGWYQSALLERVDPKGRSLGRFFEEEIARPLGVEFYFGLPASVPAERITVMELFRPLDVLRGAHRVPLGMVFALARPGSLTRRSLLNPRMRSPTEIASRRYLEVEFPSGGGIGTVRSIAKAYSEFCAAGRLLGIGSGTLTELGRPAVQPPAGARDAVLKIPTAYSLGFFRPCPWFPFPAKARVFGAPGAGGSIGFGDLDRDLAYAYGMNRMGVEVPDPRELAIRRACDRAVASLSAKK
ncbi:MAG: beta-lactamase family protein [Acidobacteriota bacterium]|nr:beta-lactamase family protein [Acidobacteriota bacterium]